MGILEKAKTIDPEGTKGSMPVLISNFKTIRECLVELIEENQNLRDRLQQQRGDLGDVAKLIGAELTEEENGQ